jgi:hypothetical protein
MLKQDDADITENDDLQGYQDSLLNLLADGLPPEEVVEVLKTDSRFEKYRPYTENFDVDMVNVACELIKKWSRRNA